MMMASRPGDPAGRPEPGQILLVIHDFTARSSDELSLTRGDNVELVERDDDFGDGWYLGKHLANGNTGLFPEVYTKPVPRESITTAPTTVQVPTSHPMSILSPPTTNQQQWDIRSSAPVAEAEKTNQNNRHASASVVLDSNKIASPLPLPVPSSYENNNSNAMPKSPLSSSAISRNLSLASAANLNALGQDSPVMNETLNVIQEHITDMNASRQSNIADRRGTNDSGSEYSSHLDRRMSYVNGEETDEEEENKHSQGEVGAWTPNQVAEYLSTMGVEPKHCDVFRDQEISGEVLLGMDQTSVFLKEFELGSVGRRLKTWQKIKALQDEVNGIAARRTTMSYGSEVGSEDNNRSRSNTMTVMPRIPSGNERSAPQQQNYRYSQQQVVRTDGVISPSPVSPIADSPTGPTSVYRPSAASIRELNHSRRHSSIDSGTMLQFAKNPDGILPQTSSSAMAAHKKLPSFDRNWTMGSYSPASASVPVSAAASNTALSNDEEFQTGFNVTSPAEFERGYDRGYFSGGEAEGRTKNTLRKRTGNTSTHSRNSSYTDEQRTRSATTNTRHSRFGSVDSIREPHLSSASQKYYGMSGRKKPSTEVILPMPPPKDTTFPIVTRLDGNGTDSPKSPVSSQTVDWLSPEASRFLGIRATSDTVTGNEKARVTSSTDNLVSLKDGSITSPSRGGSSTTSGGPSFELEQIGTSKASGIITPPGSRSGRKKSKKDTSAYTRGLEKKTPRESMLDCDYCGWMKKKSTNLMTTWKPRLFILKGRRLSYYYSETDEQERGLIDISFHRVLPADNDRLTGLHATLTGATSSPTSPSVSLAPVEAGAERSAGDTMFIFKLVPPRAGLSRVTFTKPTVHYFAVPNIAQGRLWMAALMKATIDRDESKPVTTTYQQKTISLTKARAMRHRPPALMNLDEKVEEDSAKTSDPDLNGLNIRGIIFDRDPQGDSGISGLSKLDPKNDSSSTYPYGKQEVMQPQTA